MSPINWDTFWDNVINISHRKVSSYNTKDGQFLLPEEDWADAKKDIMTHDWDRVVLGNKRKKFFKCACNSSLVVARANLYYCSDEYITGMDFKCPLTEEDHTVMSILL